MGYSCFWRLQIRVRWIPGIWAQGKMILLAFGHPEDTWECGHGLKTRAQGKESAKAKWGWETLMPHMFAFWFTGLGDRFQDWIQEDTILVGIHCFEIRSTGMLPAGHSAELCFGLGDVQGRWLWPVPSVGYWISTVFVVQSLSCVWLWDPTDCSTPGFPVPHRLPELAQTHVHWVHDTIKSSRPLSSPSPPAFNPSQHQSLF